MRVDSNVFLADTDYPEGTYIHLSFHEVARPAQQLCKSRLPTRARRSYRHYFCQPRTFSPGQPEGGQ